MNSKDMIKGNILFLFHHLHHDEGRHKIHHCGGQHAKKDNKINYTIWHCECGLHAIDKEEAIGHGIDVKLKSPKIMIKFVKKCPKGGWHLETGVVKRNTKK